MHRVIRIVAIVSGAIALAMALPAAQTPPQGPPPDPGAAGRGGGFQQQAPKNLKVLPKAWTGQQVRAVMQTFAESLGVQCTHCHAGTPPQLNYVADEKPTKEVARKMIDTLRGGSPIFAYYPHHQSAFAK